MGYLIGALSHPSTKKGDDHSAYMAASCAPTWMVGWSPPLRGLTSQQTRDRHMPCTDRSLQRRRPYHIVADADDTMYGGPAD